MIKKRINTDLFLSLSIKDANGIKQFFVNYFRRYTHYINGVYDASGSGSIEAREIAI